MSELSAYWRYNLALGATYPLLATYMAARYVSGKSRQGWAERWGRTNNPTGAHDSGRPRIWAHAVSAGEVTAAGPILQALRRDLPSAEILLSVVTPAGEEMARQHAAAADVVFFAPLDLPWVARRVVRSIRPDLFFTTESELWPNLLHELKSHGARTGLVSGRVSPGTFQRARRLAPGLYRWMLSNIDALLMQSPADAERIAQLAGSPQRVDVLGNTKFDSAGKALPVERAQELRRELGLPLAAPVWVVGSTRSRQEEQYVVRAYLAALAAVPDLCLVIAPRKLDRCRGIADVLRREGLAPVLRTSAGPGPNRQVVLDTIGELAQVYALGDVAFVGNSFAPVVKGGGQNILQPLAQGKPVLVGPHTATIRGELSMAVDERVAFVAGTPAELEMLLRRLLADAGQREEITRSARRLISAQQGAADRYAAALLQVLTDRPIGQPRS